MPDRPRAGWRNVIHNLVGHPLLGLAAAVDLLADRLHQLAEWAHDRTTPVDVDDPA